MKVFHLRTSSSPSSDNHHVGGNMQFCKMPPDQMLIVFQSRDPFSKTFLTLKHAIQRVQVAQHNDWFKKKKKNITKQKC